MCYRSAIYCGASYAATLTRPARGIIIHRSPCPCPLIFVVKSLVSFSQLLAIICLLLCRACSIWCGQRLAWLEARAASEIAAMAAVITSQANEVPRELHEDEVSSENGGGARHVRLSTGADVTQGAPENVVAAAGSDIPREDGETEVDWLWRRTDEIERAVYGIVADKMRLRSQVTNSTVLRMWI